MKRFLPVFAMALIWMASSCGNSSQAEGDTSPDGKKVYSQYCKLCHGADGQLGLNNAANLATSTLSKEEMIEVITNGRNTMQSYENILSEAQIDAVADYLLTLRQP